MIESKQQDRDFHAARSAPAPGVAAFFDVGKK
jgi:hypothetical protein